MVTLNNIDLEIKDIWGVVFQDYDKSAITIKKMLVKGLSEAVHPEPIRAMMIAERIYKVKDHIELEDADYKIVQDIVNKASWANVIKATVIECLDAATTKEE